LTKLTGSQAEYARHHDVSRQTVTDWKTRGLLAFADNGDVDFEASDRALADHGIRQPELTQVDDESFEQAFARFVESGQAVLTKAEAERVKENFAALLKQLEYDRESGAVAEIDDVAVAVAGELALVRNRLLNIGSKVAPRVAALRDAAEIKALIDSEVVLALNELTVDAPGAASYDALRAAVGARFAPAV